MRFLVEKKIAHCFAFWTVLVLLFRYLVISNIQLGHQLYNNCTRLWPTKWYKIIQFPELFIVNVLHTFQMVKCYIFH